MNKQELRDTILKIVKNIQKEYLRLSKLLYEVKVSGVFKEWGYDSFDDYCEIELKMSRRKGFYLASLYETIKALPSDAEKEFERIGDWSKAVQIVRVIKVEPDNYKKWIDIAATRPFDDVVRLVKEELKSKDTGISLAKAETLHRMSFGFYDDQYRTVLNAINVAKAISKTDSDSFALSLIALEFLAVHGAESEDTKQFLRSLGSIVERVTGAKLMIADRDGEVIYISSGIEVREV